MTESVYVEPGEIAITTRDELRNIQHLYQTGLVRRVARTSVECYYYGLYYQTRDPPKALIYFEQGHIKGCILCSYLAGEISAYDTLSLHYFKSVAKRAPARPRTANDPLYRVGQKAIFHLVESYMSEPSWNGIKKVEKYGFPELAQVIRESLTRPTQVFYHRLLSVPSRHLSSYCQTEKKDYLDDLLQDLTNQNTYFRHKCVADIRELIKQYF